MIVLRNHRLHALAAAIVAIATLALVIPSLASADCSLAEFSYNGACGPRFELPAWGDGGGWTDPSQYSTIQLADLTGSGVDELIGRSAKGLEIWYFDTSVGQWRPAIDANGDPEVLTDFASSSQRQVGPSWQNAPYYSTIQTADLDGPGHGADIIARFASGIRVYHYTPPAGTKDINGGTWSLVSQNGPFSDADGFTDPAHYLAIHVLGPSEGHPAELWGPGDYGENGPSYLGYFWTGSGWTFSNQHISLSSLNPGSWDTPANYLTLRPALLSVDSGTARAVLNRPRGEGVLPASLEGRKGDYLYPDLTPKTPLDAKPFADSTGFADSPANYTTMRLANITGGAGDELLGRTSAGLEAYQVSNDSWKQLATLGALSGSPDSFSNNPSEWASIRTGDVLGNGRDQVLTIKDWQLQAWSYDPKSNSWSQLPAEVPLDLSGDRWAKDPQYYSTIQVGDVTGDGHDAVIARGPYGIRTWFYCQAGEKTAPCGNLGGKSGWTSWQPQDPSSYPQFTDNGTSDGETHAFAALNYLARHYEWIPSDDSTVRDVWTGENAPDDDTLNQLAANIEDKAGCTGNPPSGSPPPFAQCTALPAPSDQPTGNGPFTVNDWTTVVNEILEEIKEAKDANAWFSQLSDLSMNTFIQDGSEMSAIISKLGLQGEAGDQETLSPTDISSTVLDVVAELVSLDAKAEGLSVALFLAGDLTGMLTDASQTADSKFSGTVVDLEQKFADMTSGINKSLKVQSQEVRQNYGLLSLLAQLTTGSGPWSRIDMIGMESANNEGFAQWIYQQLLPDDYDRWAVAHCEDANNATQCGITPDTTGKLQEACPGDTVVPFNGDHLFKPGDQCTILLGPAYVAPTEWNGAGVPCYGSDGFGDVSSCAFTQLADADPSAANMLWGKQSDTCAYQPGKSETAWTFGTCTLGLKPENVVSLVNGPLNGWDFQNYCWNGQYGVQQAPVTCAGSGSSVTVGQDAKVALDGTIALPKGFQAKTVTIMPNGLLHEPAAQDAGSLDVTQRDSGRPLGAVRAETAGAAATPVDSGGVRAHLKLGPARDGMRSYRLTVNGVDVHAPNPCEALPASEAPPDQTVTLTTTVLLKDGSKERRLVLSGLWRCVRGKNGNISRLVPVPPHPRPQRPGLAVSVSGPKTVLAGGTASFSFTVRNDRRNTSSRLISALWHVRVTDEAGTLAVGKKRGLQPVKRRTWQQTELRPGSAHVLRLRLKAPRTAGTRLCAAVQAIADSARSAGAHVCTRVLAPPTPSPGFTG